MTQMGTTATSKSMSSEVSPSETGGTVDPFGVPTLSDEQIEDTMQTTTSKGKRKKYGNRMMKITKRKMKGLVVVEVNPIYMECAQAKGHT